MRELHDARDAEKAFVGNDTAISPEAKRVSHGGADRSALYRKQALLGRANKDEKEVYRRGIAARACAGNLSKARRRNAARGDEACARETEAEGIEARRYMLPRAHRGASSRGNIATIISWLPPAPKTATAIEPLHLASGRRLARIIMAMTINVKGMLLKLKCALLCRSRCAE